MEFVASFLSAPRAEQDAVVQSWDAHLTWNSPNPWRLACTSERPGSSEERITTHLLLHALGYSDDYRREAIVGFAVAYNSCVLAGVDPALIFQSVAFAVGGAAKREMLGFLQRDPPDRAMEAFFLSAVNDPGGGYELMYNRPLKK